MSVLRDVGAAVLSTTGIGGYGCRREPRVRRDGDSELRPMSISLTSRSRSAAVHPSTPTSIRWVLFLSLRFRRFHPPHQIIGKTWKPPLQRLAAFADRLAFRGQGLRNG